MSLKIQRFLYPPFKEQCFNKIEISRWRKIINFQMPFIVSITEQFFTFQTQNRRNIVNFTSAWVFGIDIWLIFGLFTLLYRIFIPSILYVLKTAKENPWETIVSYAVRMLSSPHSSTWNKSLIFVFWIELKGSMNRLTLVCSRQL